MSRYARKRDTNERDIIDALRNAGCMVIQENNVDLWVLPPHLPYWVPMEVKTKTGKLTEYQQRLHTSMADDYNYKIAIVTTIDEALEAAELRKR